MGIFQRQRTRLVQILINGIEGLFFNPKLKKAYETILDRNGSNTIIDIGCNKGQSIELFLSLSKNFKIYGFEPNPSLFRKLNSKYHVYPSINLYNKGISNINGSLTFNENILDETSTFEDLNYDSKYLKKKAKVLGVKPEDIVVNRYEVEVCRISDFLKENKILEVDLIKIDVEGHELSCLKGLFENFDGLRIKYIQIESHADDMYMNRDSQKHIAQILAHNGFTEFVKIKHSFGDFYEIIYKNANLA